MRISGITYVPRKTHKARNVTGLIFFLIALVLLSSALISVYVAWNLIHPAKIGIPPFEANIVPEYKDATFTDISDSVNLSGWYFRVKDSDKAVILAHGYGKNRLQFGMQTIDLIKELITKGYNVLTFDFRNSGRSGGNKTTFGFYEKDDLLGAIKYAKSQGAKHIVLLGFSTGASTSILAAAESKDVEAIIADTPFSDLKEYFSVVIPKKSKLPAIPFNDAITYSLSLLTGLDTAAVSPEQAINKLAPRPVLFIHSKDDEGIPVNDSRQLYSEYSSIARDKTELWETKNALETDSYVKNPQEYMKTIIGFLDKVYTKGK